MPEAFFLEENDVKILREIVAAWRNDHSRLSGHQRTSPPKASEAYIALTSDSGIPALQAGLAPIFGTGTDPDAYGPDIPGSALCDIYQIVENANVRTLSAVQGLQQTVYNLSEEIVPANSWIPIIKDKFGSWLVASSAQQSSSDGDDVLWCNCRVEGGIVTTLANVDIPTCIQLADDTYLFLFSRTFSDRSAFTICGIIANNDYFYEDYAQRTTSSCVMKTGSRTVPLSHFGITVHGTEIDTPLEPVTGTGTYVNPLPGPISSECPCSDVLCVRYSTNEIPGNVWTDAGLFEPNFGDPVTFSSEFTVRRVPSSEAGNKCVWTDTGRYHAWNYIRLEYYPNATHGIPEDEIWTITSRPISIGTFAIRPGPANPYLSYTLWLIKVPRFTWDCSSVNLTGTMAVLDRVGEFPIGISLTDGSCASSAGTATGTGEDETGLYYCVRGLVIDVTDCQCEFDTTALGYRVANDLSYQTTTISNVTGWFSPIVECDGTFGACIVVESLGQYLVGDEVKQVYKVTLVVAIAEDVWVAFASCEPTETEDGVYVGSMCTGGVNNVTLREDALACQLLTSAEVSASNLPGGQSTDPLYQIESGPYSSSAGCVSVCGVEAGTATSTSTSTGGGNEGTIETDCCVELIPATLYFSGEGFPNNPTDLPLVWDADIERWVSDSFDFGGLMGVGQVNWWCDTGVWRGQVDYPGHNDDINVDTTDCSPFSSSGDFNMAVGYDGTWAITA